MDARKDLRKKDRPLPDTVPAEATRVVPGIQGKLPFQVGKLVLTPHEKAQLAKVGWKEGDPVPQLSGVVAQALQGEQQAHLMTPPGQYDENATASFRPPAVVSIDSLPESKRKEIEAAVEQMRREAAEADARAKTAGPAFRASNPSIERALAFAEMQQRREPQLEVEDDVAGRGRAARVTRQGQVPVPPVQSSSGPPAPRVVPPPAPPRAAAAPAAPTTPPAAFAPPSDPPPADGVAEPVAGTVAPQTHCPRCQHDLSVTEVVQSTLEDRRAYQAAFLGGQRFRKSYALFDGACRVVFREPTTVEVNRILKQLYMDGRANRVTNPTEVFRRAQEYQLVACLESVVTDQNPTTLPTLADYEVDQDETTTGLPDVLEHVYKTAVTTDTVRRVLLNICAEFLALLSRLEVETRQPGFTSATGAPR